MTKCNICGNKLIDTKPHYIPIGTDEVLKIIDKTCPNCGGIFVTSEQKKQTFKNREWHDKLYDLTKSTLQPQLDEKHKEQLNALIEDLNAKSDDEIFTKLSDAGIEFDDIQSND